MTFDTSISTHAVISGTGRAGTSFLVRFLAECGVPTVDLESSGFDPVARAGCERSLLDADGIYLVKDPWLHEYLYRIDLTRTSIDALILPVRNLRIAALSRVRRERAAALGSSPRLSDWDSHGTVPGGTINSLSVIDQERLLAVGLARIIEWAAENTIPMFLLHFPRLVDDREYLIDTLWPWLADFCDRETAVAAFERSSEPRHWVEPGRCIEAMDETTLDLHAQVKAQELVLEQQRVLIEVLRSELASSNEELERSRRASDLLEEDLRVIRAEHQDVTAENAVLRARLDEAARKIEESSATLQALVQSRSYRLGRAATAPFRVVRSRLQG